MRSDAEQRRRLRILHVIPAVAPRYGGPSQAVFEMCRALMERDIDPVIASTDADGNGRLRVVTGELTEYERVPAMFFPRQWSEAFKYSRPLGTWLRTHVADFDAVHIHAVFSHACLAAARSCRRAGVPYVVRPLGTLDPWSLRQKGLRKRLLWHVGVNDMLAGAAAIHYTATDEQRSVERTLRLARGVVIPLGIDSHVLDRAVPEEVFRRVHPAVARAPYIIFLSRLHPKKNLEGLLAAFLELTDSATFNHWRLVVAGEGDPGYAASLKDLVRARNAADRVLFTGWLRGADKMAALNGASLMALPSRQENFGISVVEALASGVPALVSTEVNLAGDIQSAGAGWVVPLDPVVLRDTLAEALQNQEERVRRGAAGRALVKERFTWPTVARELVRLYRTVVAACPLPSSS